MLEVHHDDGNPTNNDPKNLTTMCACCHRLFHHLNPELSQTDGRGAYAGTCEKKKVKDVSDEVVTKLIKKELADKAKKERRKEGKEGKKKITFKLEVEF